MKNIFLKLLFLIGIVFLFKSTIYADTYMYTKRDSILRNNYSKVYRPSSIIEDGVQIAVIKGTKVKILSKVNDYYYKVKIEKDGVHYLKDRTGYIIAKSLVDKEVAKDTKESRTLTVSDKTTLLKNVMTLVNVSKLSNGNINILYPTASAIEEENVDNKDVLRTAGYNFVVNGKPFKSKRSLNNGKNYYLSCSGFVSTVYNGTFGVDVTRDDGSLYWALTYKSYGVNPKKGNLFDIVYSTEEYGKVVAYARQMQIGDSITGAVDSSKTPGIEGYTYGSNQGHIMMYIGDALIAHATNDGLKIAYYDKKSKEGVSNYYLVLGNRSIKNQNGEVVSSGYRFDKGIYVVRMKKGTERTRRRIKLSNDKTKFEIKDLKKK